MKTISVLLALTVCSLPMARSFGQDNDAKSSAKIEAKSTADTEISTDTDGIPRRKKEVRIDQRLPDGRIETRTFNSDGDITVSKPKIRKRVEVSTDRGLELRADARPGKISRKGELFSLAGDDVSTEPEVVTHIEEAIRHLKEAKMPQMAARIEAELQRARSKKANFDQQLAALQNERDALRKEVRKLKRELKVPKENEANAPEKTDPEKTDEQK